MPPRPAARALGLAAFGGAAAFGLFAGCALEIDESLSCGDGYVSAAEECDPADVARAFVDACRERGFEIDAVCDPLTCQIRDADADCNVCGDGLARGDEECDGDDLRGHDCPGGALGKLGCTASCEYDVSNCPTQCGDGFRSGDEECDPALDCDEDDDCGEGEICLLALGECVLVGDSIAPNEFCVTHPAAHTGLSKAYASGMIGDCIASQCMLARDGCSFCGDGELDPSYLDYTALDKSLHPAEVCDGDQADATVLNTHCQPFCQVGQGVDVRCDFECKTDCSGLASPNDVVPGELSPSDLHCCIASGCTDDDVLPCCTNGEGG